MGSKNEEEGFISLVCDTVSQDIEMSEPQEPIPQLLVRDGNQARLLIFMSNIDISLRKRQI